MRVAPTIVFKRFSNLENQRFTDKLFVYSIVMQKSYLCKSLNLRMQGDFSTFPSLFFLAPITDLIMYLIYCFNQEYRFIFEHNQKVQNPDKARKKK